MRLRRKGAWERVQNQLVKGLVELHALRFADMTDGEIRILDEQSARLLSLILDYRVEHLPARDLN